MKFLYWIFSALYLNPMGLKISLSTLPLEGYFVPCPAYSIVTDYTKFGMVEMICENLLEVYLNTYFFVTD